MTAKVRRKAKVTVENTIEEVQEIVLAEHGEDFEVVSWGNGFVVATIPTVPRRQEKRESIFDDIEPTPVSLRKAAAGESE